MTYAENHMLVIGGGGEPQRDFTIFDTGMDTLGDNLGKANWKYQVSFNGGHAKTEDILRRKYTRPSAPTSNFTVDQYLALLKDYKAKILSGKIKAGDQLMIIIDSHGASNSTGMKTHLISATGGAAADLDNLSGSRLVSLDLLDEIVQLTNQRGIKLGIVDLSCHSGNTMGLKKNAPNTCIITATGPTHYGFAGPTAFTDKFLSNLTPGTNLEEAFLKGRMQSTDASYPMISTDAGDEIVRDVYQSITPYLYYYSPKTDKMTGYVIDTVNKNLICRREENFDRLMSQINQLSSVVKSKKNNFNADELKRLLTEYKKAQDKVIKGSMAMGGENLSRKESFKLPPNVKSVNDFKLDYTWKELLELDVDKRIAEYEKYRNFSDSAANKAINQSVIDFLKTVNQKKQSIIAQYPKMKNFTEDTRNLVKQMENTRALADQIAVQERPFYEELYRRKQSSQANNPCAQIVF